MSIRVGSFAVGLMCCAAIFPCAAIAAKANFHVVHYFTAGDDGANPVAGLVADPSDSSGNLYGVTEYGGGHNSGVIFSTTPNQNLDTILYKFTGQSGSGGTDGALPVGGLAIGNCNANTCMLYGTTSQGGASGNCTNGCGTIFEIATDGSGYAQLHSFSGSDGSNPVASLIRDSSGNLYGTTLNGGGTAFCGGTGCGTVFELAGGNFTTLYKFCVQTNCTDGQYPTAPVLIANGNIYGTTEVGGTNNKGTAYEIQIQNLSEKVLYSFCALASCADGAQPEGGLVTDGSNLYGTTFTGGGSACSGGGGGCGIVFKLSNGNESVLGQFSVNQNPQAGLTIDGGGNLYGAIPGGVGAEPGKSCPKGCQYGETFEILTGGGIQTQHGFSKGKGATPINPPNVVGTNFYGTTEFGGYPCPNHTTCGTIYEIQP